MLFGGVLMPYERRSYGLQWVEPVPRIPDFILNSIVYLYRDRDEAETGAEFGASGFLMGELSAANEKCSHIYVITNKHVVEGKFCSPVVRMNLKHPGSGFERTLVVDFKESNWVTDPKNDLAACMLPPDFVTDNIQFALLARDFVMTEKQFQEQNYGPGDQVVYIGRFVGHAGKYENTPSVRFGNISMNPNEREPVIYDTDDATRRSQVGFMVEARSRSGYSGSPVFTLNQHVVNDKRAVWPQMDMRLLGVDWGHLPEKVFLTDPQGYFHGSRWQVEVHAGMMGVIPAWHLLDFLDTAPRLIEQRKQDDILYAAYTATGVPDVSSGGDEQAPKDR